MKPTFVVQDGFDTVKIFAKLHYIRGNAKPYFSLTYESYTGGRCDSCGSSSELILRLKPELKLMASLHLSDIDGVPMHAVANGWYWLEGWGGGWGSDFHGSNDAYTTPDRCKEILKGHLRINEYEAGQLFGWISRVVQDVGPAHAKTRFADYVERLKPRWKAEADECIKQLNLKVTGDHWPDRAAT